LPLATCDCSNKTVILKLPGLATQTQENNKSRMEHRKGLEQH
jgi:hypothetical protein